MILFLLCLYFQAREANERRKVLEVSPKLSGSELVRVSMMLQEANSIAFQLGHEIIFTREDFESSENGEIVSKIGVRLYNTHTKTTTLWQLSKFENRLEHLRDLYLGESEILNSDVDIFDLTDDEWTNDPGLYTPGKANTKLFAEHLVPDCSFGNISINPLPKLPSTLPESLVNILTSSADRTRSFSLQESEIKRFSIPLDNVDLCDGKERVVVTSDLVTHSEPSSGMASNPTYLQAKELGEHPNLVRPSIAPSVPELCIERVDRLICELKLNKKVTSLEIFLNNAEFLLQYSGDFLVGYYSKLHCSNVPQAKSDDLRHTAINLSVAFEMVVTNCSIYCENIIPGLNSDEPAKELVFVGVSIKQMLSSTQEGSNVNVKYLVEQVSQHVDTTLRIISKSLLTQLVFFQLNTKRGTRLHQDFRSPDLDVQVQQLFSRKGCLSGSICRGALTYVKEVCLQVMQSVSSAYQQSQRIVSEFTKNSLVNSGILNAVCNLLKFMHHFISAVSQASDNMDKFPEKLQPIFTESWPKLVWVLNTLLSIESSVLRLTNNTKEAAENHGELEKVVSQANVIAFHTMSATTSLEEIHQCGYDLTPSNFRWEPLSKDVIRAAKVLNSLAKKCSKLSTTSIAIGQFE